MDDEGILPEGVVPIPFSEVGPNDVLCGRGGSINTHVGNERYRQIVESKKRVYLTARFKREKRLIASSIVDEIHALDPPGRFLTKIRAPKGEEDSTSSSKRNKKGAKVPDLGWYEVEDEKARDKTSQALRENAPEIRKEMEVERKQYMMERQQKMQDDYDDYDDYPSFDEGDVNYHSPQQRRHHPSQHPPSHYPHGSWMSHFPESQVTHSWNSFKNAFMPYGAPTSSNHVTPEVGRTVAPPGSSVYGGSVPNGTRLSFDEQERISKPWAPYTKPADPPVKPNPRYPSHHGQNPYQQHPPMVHNHASSHTPLPPMSPMEQTPAASADAYGRTVHPHQSNHPNMPPPPVMLDGRSQTFENPPPPPPSSSLLHQEQQRARQQQENSSPWSSPERRPSSLSPHHVTPDQQPKGFTKDQVKGQKRKTIQTNDADPAMQGGQHNKPALSVRSADIVTELDKEESWEHGLDTNSLLEEMEIDENMGLGSADLADLTPRVGDTVTTTMVHDTRDDTSDDHGGGGMGMCGMLPDTMWFMSCAFGMPNRGTSVGNSIGTMDDADSLATPLGGASLCNVFDFEDSALCKPMPIGHAGRQRSVRSSIQDSEIVVNQAAGPGRRRSTVSPLTLQRDKSDRSFKSHRGGQARRSFENLMQPSPINAQGASQTEDVVMGDFAASWARGSLGSE